MFTGRYIHSIGKNGRTSLPVKFRETLNESGEDHFIVTNFEDCLVAYTPTEWEKILEKLKTLPQTSKERIGFVRFVVSGAQPCSIDKQGRILIPPSLREYAELKEEILIVGMIDWIEIWSKDKWNIENQNNRKNLSANMQFLSGLGV